MFSQTMCSKMTFFQAYICSYSHYSLLSWSLANEPLTVAEPFTVTHNVARQARFGQITDIVLQSMHSTMTFVFRQWHSQWAQQICLFIFSYYSSRVKLVPDQWAIDCRPAFHWCPPLCKTGTFGLRWYNICQISDIFFKVFFQTWLLCSGGGIHVILKLFFSTIMWKNFVDSFFRTFPHVICRNSDEDQMFFVHCDINLNLSGASGRRNCHNARNKTD